VHASWRRRFERLQNEERARLDELQLIHDQLTTRLQSRQEAVFNSMVEGLLLLDSEGRIQLANPAFAELFDVAGDIRGRTVLEVLRLHELTGLLERVATTRQVLDYELKITGLADRWLQINGAIACGDRTAQGTILVFQALTQLKQLERTREEFVANVSHELRTPLSLIKGYVETLLDGAKDNPEVETKFLQTIQRNSERLQFLIEISTI
jgi:two-component system phosphate regulon sensor histidine kinase PhoR